VVSGSTAFKFVFILLRKNDSLNLWEFVPMEKMERPSFPRFITSLAFLALSFAIAQYFLLGRNNFIYKNHELSLVLLTSAWLVSSLLTNKFFPQTGRNIYYKIAPFVKSSVLMLFLLGAVYYLLRLENSVLKTDLFITAILFCSVESILALLYFNSSRAASEPVLTERESHFNQSNLSMPKGGSEDYSGTFLSHVKRISYDNLESRIYDELSKALEDESVQVGKFRIFFDRTDGNLRLLEPSSLNCVFNYCPINDFRVINKSLRASYKALVGHGYLIGLYTPQENDRHDLERKMPRSIFVIYYPLHYIFKRLLPKLPYLSRLYDFITSGRNRLISRAEFLGRLAYAGFGVKNEIPVNGKVLFIANKVMTPACEEFPSYGPIVRLKRIGLDGRVFRIYKFRTMFPYSEFIQDHIYKDRGLNADGDKINDDFRKTFLGNIIRRLWIDELPQLLNWINGDVGFVGVRALSQAKYDLYPADLQDLRVQFKPGLIPPFYADLPKSFDELIESERRYLLSKKEKPFSTDWKYFWKAFFNIVFRGARSG